MRPARRPLLTRWLPFAAGMIPALGALALVNWRLYGSPLLSGYGEVTDLFSVAAILPNARGYATVSSRESCPHFSWPVARRRSFSSG